MKDQAEKIKPYDGDNRAKGDQVKDMFDNIAPAYDFMNRAMTLGIDKSWRKKAVNIIKEHRNATNDGTSACNSYAILDVATGTGDLALQMAREIPGSSVTGIDLSDGMVEIGMKKVADAGMQDRIKLQIADCMQLPFADNMFDCASVAFGVRNFEHLAEGYAEMLRVLKPGGLLCVIELSVPPSPIVRPFYRLYTRHIIPFVGRLISKDTSAYSYLPASIEAVAQRGDMTALIESVGFVDARFIPLTFGVCTIYTARKKA